MLKEPQVEMVRRRGCLVVEDVVPEAVLAAVEAEYDALLRGLADGWGVPRRGFRPTLRAAHLAGHDWFQPFDISLPGGEIAHDTPFHAGPAVFALLTCPAILDVAERLVGSEITSTPIQHLRIKPPAREVARDEARAHVTGTIHRDDVASGPRRGPRAARLADLGVDVGGGAGGLRRRDARSDPPMDLGQPAMRLTAGGALRVRVALLRTRLRPVQVPPPPARRCAGRSGRDRGHRMRVRGVVKPRLPVRSFSRTRPPARVRAGASRGRPRPRVRSSPAPDTSTPHATPVAPRRRPTGDTP